MKIFIPVVFLFITQLSTSQSNDSISINYNSLNYEIINRDTNVLKVTTNDSPLPKFLYLDTTIFAHIIFPNLPLNNDTVLLKEKIKEIMISENLNNSYVWRDKNSFAFIMLSFRSEEMKKIEDISFVSWTRLNNLNEIKTIKWGLKN